LALLRHRQRRRCAVGHTDFVRVERERNHGIIADQRGELDDAGGAIGREDALVGRVAGAMVAQQLGGVVADRLFVRRLERAASVPQRLYRLVGQACLARLRLVREPLELAVLVYIL